MRRRVKGSIEGFSLEKVSALLQTINTNLGISFIPGSSNGRMRPFEGRHAGSSPAPGANFAPVAQQIEHRASIPGGVGANPTGGAIFGRVAESGLSRRV